MAAPADEGNPVIERGHIDLSTSFTIVPGVPYYARTCEHRPRGTFSASVLSEPTLKEEWHIDKGQSTYEWSGIDGVASGRGNSIWSVNLEGVGTSYDVVATATWALTKDDGTTATTTASKAMTFDAIEYDFKTLASGGENQFVDSQEATLQVGTKGCTQTDLLSLSPTSKPKPALGVNPQNETNSTEMTFICRGNPLLWKIPCTYWYGGSPSHNPPACCYSNEAKYELSLNPDGCGEHKREVSAHLPSSDLNSFMHPECELAKVVPEELENVEIDGVLNYRLKCSISDFVPHGFVSCGATSQYKGKIKEEEEVHRRQFERKKGYGFEDMFSLEDVFKRLGLTFTNEMILQGESLSEIDEMVANIRLSIDNENKLSWKYWSVNQNYQDSIAKQKVKFREAYLYHCCYGRFPGNKQEPIVKIPKTSKQ